MCYNFFPKYKNDKELSSKTQRKTTKGGTRKISKSFSKTKRQRAKKRHNKGIKILLKKKRKIGILRIFLRKKRKSWSSIEKFVFQYIKNYLGTLFKTDVISEF